jgi:hypothetical protein
LKIIRFLQKRADGARRRAAGRRARHLAVGFIVLVMLGGCWSRPKPASIPGYAERGIRLIAVMPVKAKTADMELSRLMRERVVETLYFKGYPRIPIDAIDGALAKVYDKPSEEGGIHISPQVIRSILNVEAVLYVTLDECRTATTYLYASTMISAGFELRDGKTGETLWKAQPRNVERNFDITKQRLERTVYQVLEPAIQDVVEKALQGLPDGPDIIR